MTVRTRNYACIIYPDSAPKNFIEKLEEACIPMLLSPLHDKDIDGDGVLKKPHYHLMIMFSGVKSASQVRQILDPITSVSHIVVNDMRAHARYLCHLDSPHKHIYDVKDVIELSGANYHDITNLVQDDLVLLGEMIDFCDKNEIYMFGALVRYSKLNRFDWYRLLATKYTIFIKEYLKSSGYEKKVMKEDFKF